VLHEQGDAGFCQGFAGGATPQGLHEAVIGLAAHGIEPDDFAGDASLLKDAEQRLGLSAGSPIISIQCVVQSSPIDAHHCSNSRRRRLACSADSWADRLDRSSVITSSDGMKDGS
jgi:hypothetical protein